MAARTTSSSTKVNVSSCRATVTTGAITERNLNTQLQSAPSIQGSPSGPQSLYTPLPSPPPYIRVIELSPGSGPLYCRLKTVLLEGSDYETVSYCWTVASVNDPLINVDGHQIAIRQSLAAALRRLRLSDRTRVLWVDALCINQESTTEKSDQVSKMRDIYASASQNNIWLGEHDASTAQVFELIQDITSDERSASFDIRAVYSGFMLNQESPFYLLLTLCVRPWFHRGWIVQEVTVAKESTVYCGDHVVPWTKFSMARDMMMPALGMVYDTLSNQRLAYLEQTDDLASILARNISYNVTDPRDRVHSVLGLLNVEKRFGMKPDYSIDPGEVLLHATYRSIEWRGNLDILSAVATKTHPNDNRPSWVLAKSFSWQDDTMPFQAFAWRAQLLRHGGPRFSCSDTSVLSCRLIPHNHGLEVVGHQFAQVDRVAVPYSPDEVRATKFGFFFDIIQGMQPWLEWRQLADVDGGHIYPLTHETMRSVYWQTTAGGVLYEDYFVFERLFHDFEDTYKAMHLIPACMWSCRMLVGFVLVYYFIVARIKMMFGKEFAVYFEQCATIRNRRAFTTTNGAFGMGPKAMLTGDSVFILRGAKIPMILRPSDDAAEWTLVGEGYVHGIMHGEAYRDELCRPVTIV